MDNMVPQSLDTFRHALKALARPLAAPLHLLRQLVTLAPGLALLELAALLVTALLAVRGNRLAALGLVPLSLGWLVVNTPFEGPTLLALSWSHGITASDLVAFVGLGIAAWRLGGALLEPLRG